MTIWDDHHRMLWVDAVNAEANQGAAADHDPHPAMLDGTAQDTERAVTALHTKVAALGGIDTVLADPNTREEFAAAAARAQAPESAIEHIVRRVRGLARQRG